MHVALNVMTLGWWRRHRIRVYLRGLDRAFEEVVREEKARR